MKLATLILATLAATLALASERQARIPSTLNYQGRILQNGVPFSGTGYFLFGIYDGIGNILWTNESESSDDNLKNPDPNPPPGWVVSDPLPVALEVRNGLFSVALGDGTENNRKLATDDFFNGTEQSVRQGVHLRVWFSPDGSVGTWTRLQPDVTFASVPFAHVAAVAESVKAGAITGNMIATGAVTTEKANPNLASALNPVGTVLAYAGSVSDNGQAVEPRSGYLLCNGATLNGNDAKYSALWEAIGITYGGTGKSSFKVPDLRSRTVLGAGIGEGIDSQGKILSNRVLGQKIGSETHQLTIDEMPEHRHPITVVKADDFNLFQTGGAYVTGSDTSQTPNRTTTDNSIGTVGKNSAHNNMPPSLVLNYIIKY